MDFITKKTTHQIMPLFSTFWTSAPAKSEEEETVEASEAKDKGPMIIVNAPSTENYHAVEDIVGGTDRPLSTASLDATAIPLPMSPAPTSPQITKVSSKRRRKTRSFTPSKVFLLKTQAAKRSDGKKGRMAASDVTIHFPKLHIDKGMPEDMQDRLVEASNAADVDLDGYTLSANSISSFSLLSVESSAQVANFSLPLHPHKVITVFFPPSSPNSRPRPQSCNSSISNSSAASIASASRRQQPKKMTQKMLTMTSPGSKSKAFIFDGFNYKWTIEEDGTRVLRRYSASTESSSKAVDSELCAKYSAIKRKHHSALLVDPSRCDERVAIATLFVKPMNVKLLTICGSSRVPSKAGTYTAFLHATRQCSGEGLGNGRQVQALAYASSPIWDREACLTVRHPTQAIAREDRIKITKPGSRVCTICQRYTAFCGRRPVLIFSPLWEIPKLFSTILRQFRDQLLTNGANPTHKLWNIVTSGSLGFIVRKNLAELEPTHMLFPTERMKTSHGKSHLAITVMQGPSHSTYSIDEEYASEPVSTPGDLGMAISGKQAIACEWAFFGLAAFFVFFRLFVRIFITCNPGFSDGLVILVLICFLSTAVCDTIAASKGLFAENLTYESDLIAAFEAHGGSYVEELVVVLQILYASSFPYICELWGLKVCFLLLYGGLIPPSMKWLRNCLYATWLIVGIGFIASMLLMALWCLPVSRNWDVTMLKGNEGRCFAYSSYEPYFTLTAFHIVTDFMIYALPFPILKSLSLNRRQHLGVISIFALGGVCIASTIGRTVSIGLTSNIPLVGFWTSFEQMTGLIVVCIPALKVLILEHRSRDGSRVKVDFTDGGSRLSRLQRISVSAATRSDPRGGTDEELETDERWIRIDSPVEGDAPNENHSVGSISIQERVRGRASDIEHGALNMTSENGVNPNGEYRQDFEDIESPVTMGRILHMDTPDRDASEGARK
ncbi:hypothetical protein TWF102_002963 [Orbilia oligospora]|uniref:Rhodopsin domain-containing protein n=2 Tax=Orbilia oligospora TaxID=2813651 RepID=A0A7C8NFT0_ORBOL|nr:hypothetical protein TWF102_002963 [Orbilia oligospora]